MKIEPKYKDKNDIDKKLRQAAMMVKEIHCGVVEYRRVEKK